ncbi:MAG: hypothetical protein M5U28_10925 [Sandaracinaceae bacterium]|nr:hypothetical protein [Sandaracinaceae bacterium]
MGVDDAAEYPSSQVLTPGAPLQPWEAFGLTWDADYLYVTMVSQAFEDQYKPVHVYLEARASLGAAAPSTGKTYNSLTPQLPFTPTHVIAVRRTSDSGLGRALQRRLHPGLVVGRSRDASRHRRRLLGRLRQPHHRGARPVERARLSERASLERARHQRRARKRVEGPGPHHRDAVDGHRRRLLRDRSERRSGHRGVGAPVVSVARGPRGCYMSVMARRRPHALDVTLPPAPSLEREGESSRELVLRHPRREGGSARWRS